MSEDVIGLGRSVEYAMKMAPSKFGGLFGVFGLAQEGVREDNDGPCSNIETGER